MPGKTSFHDWKKLLQWLGIAALAVLVLLAATQRRQSRPADTADSLPDAADTVNYWESLSQEASSVVEEDTTDSDTPAPADEESTDHAESQPAETAPAQPDDTSTEPAETRDPFDPATYGRNGIHLMEWTSMLLGEEPLPEGEALLEELQTRMDEAESITDLRLDGLTFPARCALLMQWELDRLAGSFGLVDMTLDGIPEFFTQSELTLYGEAIIYDISGITVRPLRRVWCGTDVEQTGQIYDRPVVIPSEGMHVWQVYATVFPDGSPGGIIETVGNWRVKETYYFTTNASQFPLESPICVEQELTNVTDEKHGVYFSLQYMKQKEVWIWDSCVGYGCSFFWDCDEMEKETFLSTIEDTWIGVLRDLPRQRWSSPLVRTDWIYSYFDPGESRQNMLAKIVLIAEELYKEYNAKLVSGDY